MARDPSNPSIRSAELAALPLGTAVAEGVAMVNAEIQAQGATSMRDMGSVMGVLKSKTAGRADPATISKLVKNALQG